jgi:phosphatidylglycerol lysyltransferase
LSALSGVGEQSDDPIVERALNFIYQNVDRFYNFRGLHSFKEKFHPAWSERYLAYPSMSNLPTISAAIFRASLGGEPLSLIRRG